MVIKICFKISIKITFSVYRTQEINETWPNLSYCPTSSLCPASRPFYVFWTLVKSKEFEQAIRYLGSQAQGGGLKKENVEGHEGLSTLSSRISFKRKIQLSSLPPEYRGSITQPFWAQTAPLQKGAKDTWFWVTQFRRNCSNTKPFPNKDLTLVTWTSE